MTETWLSNTDQHEQTIAELKIDGYVFQNAPRADNRRGGGIALLYKESIRCVEMPRFEAESFENLTVLVTSGSHRFKLVIIYRPQVDEKKKSTTARFFDEFPNLLEPLLIDSIDFIIGGDFNFHWDVATHSSATRLHTS